MLSLLPDVAVVAVVVVDVVVVGNTVVGVVAVCVALPLSASSQVLVISIDRKKQQKQQHSC